jgi:hypothetical protein
MALLTNDEISAAWRALSGTATENGWRSIPISGNGFNLLRAGRRFPCNEEALLVCFGSIVLPKASFYPEGNGFKVEQITLGDSQKWIALVRQKSANFELFQRMVVDIISILGANSTAPQNQQFQIFLGRIKAWQEFMKKGGEGLGPEAELGLIGELDFLNSLLEQGLPQQIVLDAWKGPFDGIQDFELGHGAIEIKSTLSPVGFIASIMSLEQLDDSVRHPLFLCGSRFSVDLNGLNLSQRVNEIRKKLSGVDFALFEFNNALLSAGFFDEHAECYTRTFSSQGFFIIHINESFPRLIVGNVPFGVCRAKYEVNLDVVKSKRFSIEEVLELSGVI